MHWKRDNIPRSQAIVFTRARHGTGSLILRQNTDNIYCISIVSNTDDDPSKMKICITFCCKTKTKKHWAKKKINISFTMALWPKYVLKKVIGCCPRLNRDSNAEKKNMRTKLNHYKHKQNLCISPRKCWSKNKREYLVCNCSLTKRVLKLKWCWVVVCK